ncbi:hypothetical protein [Niabella hirudinis]|uniref:hypothetical protein n=1 Tax=Niabella hirudinis TaxID=1285929 RepID=UPI003EBA6227
MSGFRYIKLLVLWSIAGIVTGCQKNGESTPGQYTLTTIFENPLPEAVTIQYFNARIKPNGDTTVLFSGEKILVDANSSTQVVETICLKDCPPHIASPEFNMARVTIGDKQKTDINCKLFSSDAAAAHCEADPYNIFNEAQWSVTKKSSGDLLKTYTLNLFEPGDTR